MKRILLATTNQHKIEEFATLLQKYSNSSIKLISLHDVGGANDDAPENGATFIENARQKALYYWQKYQMPVLCDDSGLEVLSLDNFPGIHSKRWLEQAGFVVKIQKLLQLIGDKNPTCQYVCALVYKDQDHEVVFSGKVQGQLIEPIHQNGFGFDIGFYLTQYRSTFYELGIEQKNQISHRAQAFRAFMTWWEQLCDTNK